MDPQDRDGLYEEEFQLLDRMNRKLEQGSPGGSWRDDLQVMTSAYAKLLRDTVKLNRVSDRQHAWLIDSHDRLKSTNEDLQKVSSADMLTGLFNRHKMDRILRDELRLRGLGGAPSSLILIDIDHFKSINDTWGHNEGDEVLVFFAQTLRNRIRSTDYGSRWGGDEFLVLLPNTAGKDAVKITEQIQNAIVSAPFPCRPFTVSLGVAELAEGMSLEEWLSLADQCLYWAKRQGRNRIGYPELLG